MMALTPEEMAEIEAQLKTRMGVKPPAVGAEMAPGAKPEMVETPTIGAAPEGGMGFGGVNAAKPQEAKETPFDPNAGFNFNPSAGTEDGGAMGGLAKGLTSSLSMANALRKSGKEPFGGIKSFFKQ